MSRLAFRSAAVLASAAALSMMATPAAAQSWGWGGGWGGGGWGHRHDRVDAGDVIAGILIIGGIAAIASAASKASKASKDRRYEDRRYPDNRNYPNNRDNPNYRGDYRDAPGRDGYRAGGNGDMTDAVNRCADEVNRGRSRVETIDSAERDGNGWRVRGRVDNNMPFTCSIDGDGRIRQVSIDGHAV